MSSIITVLLFSVLLILTKILDAELTCEPMPMDSYMCMHPKLGYNLTSLPNLLNHASVADAALELHQFWPLVKVECSAALRPYLCSLYFPMCLPNQGTLSPCRRLCEAAYKGCAPLMRRFGFRWPRALRCGQWTDEGSCYEGPVDLLSHKPGDICLQRYNSLL
ncbi:frizzled-7 [Lingula anatina]|uniref:Frizzled-7 n=1 Tax=Lingula anatina TaxID=7574 RepID=A0A1S3HNH8_LINAN|nr:frizzled-7 [Lingula anatina]|eukprot:XP_013387590.1 frizzled-7 [Lingula anatina]